MTETTLYKIAAMKESNNEIKELLEYIADTLNRIEELLVSYKPNDTHIPILMQDVDNIDLSARAINCLKRGGCETVQDVLNAYCDESLPMFKNLGRKCYEEIEKKLIEFKLIDGRV